MDDDDDDDADGHDMIGDEGDIGELDEGHAREDDGEDRDIRNLVSVESDS